MIEAVTITTPELGDRSYLVHDGRVGVVVDAQRDTDRLLRGAAAIGVRIALVAETHLHNDYVSGGWALSQELGIPYLVAAAEVVTFDRRPVTDGDEVAVAPGFTIRVVATPGHTPHHVAYVAVDRGRPVLACTGGSLLFGTVGRTDLLGADLAVPLARAQFRSARRLGALPGEVQVLPTHGFGSFCSVGASTVDGSTIAEQLAANAAFQAGSEEEFATVLVARFGDYPTYYHRMADRNRQGPTVPVLSPPPLLDAHQARRLAAGDAWVVDLRARGAFAARHLARTINVEADVPFTTYLGWLLPDDTPLVLMAEDRKTITTAQVDLSRIGLESLAGQYVGPLPPDDSPRSLRSYPVASFADLSRARTDGAAGGGRVAGGGVVALDVRRQEEWEAGHLDDAVHLPLHHLLERMGDLPDGTVWVHCAAGYRAAIAASLLARSGRDVVLVDGRFAPQPA